MRMQLPIIWQYRRSRRIPAPSIPAGHDKKVAVVTAIGGIPLGFYCSGSRAKHC